MAPKGPLVRAHYPPTSKAEFGEVTLLITLPCPLKEVPSVSSDVVIVAMRSWDYPQKVPKITLSQGMLHKQ